ncbi:hypothetical protein BKA82DRAFT_2788797 [Pisolithus tinctorius]|nr:hypothetical protein BKA82DRAFT_2788797 [Pisolithus tinctorius]
MSYYCGSLVMHDSLSKRICRESMAFSAVSAYSGKLLKSCLQIHRVARLLTPHVADRLILQSPGSDSTYVYDYCNASYQEGWGRALALTIKRDGSSEGVVRMRVTTENGVKRYSCQATNSPSSGKAAKRCPLQ